MAFLAQVLAWAQGSLITTLSVFSIIAVGGTMAFMRFHPMAILGVMAGVWIMFNAETIAGMLH